MGKYKDLSDQIWTTRISRVNAEKRLIDKESFFQAINIYYSCVTIIFSILALLNNKKLLYLFGQGVSNLDTKSTLRLFNVFNQSVTEARTKKVILV